MASGESEMSLAVSEPMVRVERVAGGVKAFLPARSYDAEAHVAGATVKVRFFVASHADVLI